MAKAKKRPVGRPSDYDQIKAAEICGLLVTGQSLNSICKQEGMPSVVAVYRWIAKHEEFRNMYEEARENQAETLADSIQQITDEEPPVLIDDNGNKRVDSGWVQMQRLRVDARKWIAAKLKPRKYGDKLDVQHAGGISVVVATGIPDDKETH